jgi:hypothetical protein
MTLANQLKVLRAYSPQRKNEYLQSDSLMAAFLGDFGPFKIV